jgi:hypothetical protein
VVSVDLPEAADDEAPVAIRYRCFDHREGDWKAPVELRWKDGALWELESGRDVEDGPMGIAEFQRRCADPEDGAMKPGSVFDFTRRAAARLEDDRDMRAVEASERDERASVVRAKAQELLVVDGELWRRAVEPRLVVAREWSCVGGRDAKVCNVETWATYDLNAGRRFRMDQLDGIGELNGDCAGISNPPQVEVLVPEAVSFPADEICLVENGLSLLERMKRHALEESADYLAAFVALRDGLAASGFEFDGGKGKDDDRQSSQRRAWFAAPESFDADAFVETLRVAVRAENLSKDSYSDWSGGALERYDRSRDLKESVALAGMGA